jgi:transcriptional regulator with XRE-family HTH domain
VHAARPGDEVGSPTGGASFGSELRRLRLLAGLSQEMLAERAGLSTASIAAYERNRRRRPYANTLASLATALELAPVHFAAAADALRSRLGVQAQEVEQQRVNASMEVALRMLGAATFAAEWTAGRRMDIAQLVAAAQQASP